MMSNLKCWEAGIENILYQDKEVRLLLPMPPITSEPIGTSVIVMLQTTGVWRSIISDDCCYYSLLDVSELDVRADSVVERLLLAVAHQLLLPHLQQQQHRININVIIRAAKDPSVLTITEKAPTRASSWLREPTSASTLKTLSRHYAKR